MTPRYAKLRDSGNKVFGCAHPTAASRPCCRAGTHLGPAFQHAALLTTSKRCRWENFELISDRPFEVMLAEMKRLRQEYPDRVLIASIMEEYSKGAWEEIIGRCARRRRRRQRPREALAASSTQPTRVSRCARASRSAVLASACGAEAFRRMQRGLRACAHCEPLLQV